MMKNGSELRCDRAAARSGSSRRRRDERGERACSLLCRSTLIYCRRYFLVGASWRLPHHRARQWRARLTFCFELLPALARPVLSISPLRPLLHQARQCSILFCSIFILFCLFVFFLSRYFSAAARSLLRRRGTSTRIRLNFAALVAQIYHRNYARNSCMNDLLDLRISAQIRLNYICMCRSSRSMIKR